MGFQSGVKNYITGKAEVTASFPIDVKGHVYLACEFCRFYKPTSHRCGLNGEIPAFPDRFIGDLCPLKFETDEEENIE